MPSTFNLFIIKAATSCGMRQSRSSKWSAKGFLIAVLWPQDRLILVVSPADYSVNVEHVMQQSHEVEFAALLEKLETDELPVAAARLLAKWCQAKGSSHEAVYSFFAMITDQQSGSAREQLEMMSATYAAARGAMLDQSKSSS